MHRSLPVSLARSSWRTLCAVALTAVAASGCGSDSVTGPRALPVTISGTLTNRSGAPIPATARVVVMWAGDDESGDYAYVFGEGTVDAATNRFTVTFDRDVPSGALLNDEIGIGFVLLTTDANLHEGRVPDA